MKRLEDFRRSLGIKVSMNDQRYEFKEVVEKSTMMKIDPS